MKKIFVALTLLFSLLLPAGAANAYTYQWTNKSSCSADNKYSAVELKRRYADGSTTAGQFVAVRAYTTNMSFWSESYFTVRIYNTTLGHSTSASVKSYNTKTYEENTNAYLYMQKGHSYKVVWSVKRDVDMGWDSSCSRTYYFTA